MSTRLEGPRSLADNYTKAKLGSFTSYYDPDSEPLFHSGPMQTKSCTHFHGGSFHSSPSRQLPLRKLSKAPRTPSTPSPRGPFDIRNTFTSPPPAGTSHNSSSPSVFPPLKATSNFLTRGFSSRSQQKAVQVSIPAVEAEIARGRVTPPGGSGRLEVKARTGCLLKQQSVRCGRLDGDRMAYSRLRLSEKGGVSAAPAGPPLGTVDAELGSTWQLAQEKTSKTDGESLGLGAGRSCLSSLEDHLQAQRKKFETSPPRVVLGRHKAGAEVKLTEVVITPAVITPAPPTPKIQDHNTPAKVLKNVLVPAPGRLLWGSLFPTTGPRNGNESCSSSTKDDAMSVLSVEFARARLRRRSGKTPAGIPKMSKVLDKSKDQKHGSTLRKKAEAEGDISERRSANTSIVALKSPPCKASVPDRQGLNSIPGSKSSSGRLGSKSSSTVSTRVFGRLTTSLTGCFSR